MVHDHGVHIHTYDPSNQAQCNMTSSPDKLSLSTSDLFDEELDILTRLDIYSFQFFWLGPAGTKCSCCFELVLWILNDGIPDVVVNDGPVSLLPELALARSEEKTSQDPTRRNLKIFCPRTQEGNILLSLPFQTCATCSKKPGSRNKGSLKTRTLESSTQKAK